MGTRSSSHADLRGFYRGTHIQNCSRRASGNLVRSLDRCDHISTKQWPPPPRIAREQKLLRAGERSARRHAPDVTEIPAVLMVCFGRPVGFHRKIDADRFGAKVPRRPRSNRRSLCAVGARRALIEPSTRGKGAIRNSGSTPCTRTGAIKLTPNRLADYLTAKTTVVTQQTIDTVRISVTSGEYVSA